ncbi:hypothetical protein TD95_000949 [Thielaviopsis punctulata]|uniref:Uncharacterized protein n=1 Tax=Thielaviopsis punctulata TaxID=72032 RepID=A0A0F4ZFE4_9PEZI|nr:hypothetical protein TD95_000949 [Thielaviopsis punctulata]
MADIREPSRLRSMLNPLRTSVIGSTAPPQMVPLSAASITSSSYMQSPASSIQPYNPQEWIGAPPSRAPDRPVSAFSHTRESVAEQSQPSPSSGMPPPPYSPPRSSQPRPLSMNFEPSTANISAARVPPTRIISESPQNFPPPPSSRGPSRERRFGLPSLGRRRDAEQTPPPIHSPAENALGIRGNNIRGLSVHIPAADVSAIFSDPEPPSARRAVSTGAIISQPPDHRSRSSSQVRWELGMPLPPPPPGPPPSQSRSQSVQSDDRNRPVISPPTRRPPPGGISALGPVPPTPANWVDETPSATPPPPPPPPPPAVPTVTSSRQNPAHHTLTTSDASVASSASASGSDHAMSDAASRQAELEKTASIRHGKTIAQRRSESRTRNRLSLELTDTPANIAIPSTTTLTRSGATRTTPKSGKFNETPRTGEHPKSGGDPLKIDTSSPYAPSSSRRIEKLMAQTPPIRSTASSLERRGTPSAETPHNALIAAKQKAIVQTADQFSHDTVERFQNFAIKEASAASDAERVRLFADFIVNESRIRRERYSSAINIMGSEIFDLTRDLFRPMATRRSSSTSRGEWTPGSSAVQSTTTAASNFKDGVPSSSSMPTSAGASSSLPPSPGPANSQWPSNGFMPSLSPILSLSIADDCDSRGRPASRWWESGSQGRVEGRMERSKRESKYMGVPKELHEALQWQDEPQAGSSYDPSSARSSAEYPPEKVGLHEESNLTPQQNRFSVSSLMTNSQPTTPNALSVDVSRLVTLPPPYPRHHPAVNNNHPDLSDVRVEVRSLSDMSAIANKKEAFQSKSTSMRSNLAKEHAEARQELSRNLQTMINSGEMSYMDAGAIEKDHKEQEQAKIKELEKKDFEGFQMEVVVPLNEILTARIAKATELLNNLAIGLFDNSANAADLPQEEGDDKPELLEKLTLLKWIFEARESLHKAIFDLLSDRNDRYRDVVMAPYRLSGNEEKLRNAEAFFKEDAAKRRYAFAIEVHDRTLEFQNVVEQNVMRGCQVQLNAFWDIAPPLSRVLEKVPTTLSTFRIVIPGPEYAENPTYYDHPMQYLFSLLQHAEKSTYQFIESQTNMLCLLHEVKEAKVHAHAAILEAQTIDADTGMEINEEERKNRAAKLLRVETETLTQDLKEKVRTVEDQWKSGFGEVVESIKERVGEYLLQTGGWDEQLEEGGLPVGVL